MNLFFPLESRFDLGRCDGSCKLHTEHY